MATPLCQRDLIDSGHEPPGQAGGGSFAADLDRSKSEADLLQPISASDHLPAGSAIIVFHELAHIDLITINGNPIVSTIRSI